LEGKKRKGDLPSVKKKGSRRKEKMGTQEVERGGKLLILRTVTQPAR